MKRILSIVIGLMLALPSFADGLQYLGHCKSLYNSGRYEEAKQGFTLCKVYDDIDDAEMDVWIAKCESAITAKKNRAAAAARKAETERQAAFEESQKLRKERNLIYVSTNARTLSADYPNMQSAIKGNLRPYHFAKTEEDARWGIYVTANAREQINPEVNTGLKDAHFVYADGILQIIDLLSGEICFEQDYSPKFASTNLDISVKRAYKDLIDAISTDILKTITQ